jgi:hypothetical protein
MGSRKGGDKPKISYYHMSIHQALCHGPITSLNQIWIKEKKVASGMLTANSVVYLHDSELFGGEEKEGGIDGVAEVYLGGPEQVMTNFAAARFGESSTTMPGYRGIASIFFRGYDDIEIGNRPGSSSANAGRFIFDLFADLASSAFDAVNTFLARGGFQWTANNPYLPPAWAHVTVIDTPFAPSLATVYHAPVEPAEDIALDPPPHNSNGPINQWLNPYGTRDLSEIATQIDAGVVTVTLGYTAEASGSGVNQQLFVRGYDADGAEVTWSVAEGGENDQSGSGPGGLFEMTRTIPPGTRRLDYTIRSIYFALTTDVTVTETHCTVFAKRPGIRLDDASPLLGAHPNMNPAHIIAECLTNVQWGMGRSLSMVDLDSFEYAAQTFFDENFGLAMQWREQIKVEAFVQEVLDHVQATMFLDPRTGLYRLVPIRDDYDIDTLPVLDGTNCYTLNRQRKGQGEIINELVISYTDAQTEEKKTITFHDLASISQLGQIVSETRDYYGVRDPVLANRIGARDMRSASYPLFSCEVVAHRDVARSVFPGGCAKLTVAEDGIVNMVVRIMDVDYGEPSDRSVRLKVIEDVFALEQTNYTTSQPSLWQSPDTPPEPLPYERLIDPPLPMLIRSGVSESDYSDDNYPESATVVLGEDPTVNVIEVNIWGELVQPNGDIILQIIGAVPPTPVATLDDPLVIEPTSTLTGAFVREVSRPQTPVAGNFLYIDGGNADGEFVMLDSYDSGTDVWTIARGMYDTVPHAWSVGHIVWFCENALDAFYPGEVSDGTEITVKLLPRTSGGTLDESEATEIAYTPSSRPYRPFRPADVKIGGVGFGEAAYSSSDPGGIPTDAPVTWATRNRLQEDGQALRWEEGTVTAEVGQTTTLEFRERDSQTLVLTISGLTGTSYDLDLTVPELETFRFYDVTFLSERDGYISLQGHTVGLSVERLGYGSDYGYDYGENDGE